MLAVLYLGNRMSQETSNFDSIISNILEANTTLHSTKLDLNVDNFRPFLKAVSIAWETIVKSSRTEDHQFTASQESPNKVYIKCVQHIVPVLEESHDNKRNTRDNLLEITAKFLGNEKFDQETIAVLRLAIYIWSMCEIDVPKESINHLHTSNLKHWIEPQSSLRDQIARLCPGNGMTVREVRLDRSFRLYDLQRIANFEVKWTSDILQHLSLCEPDVMSDDETMKIRIFHHRRFLKFHADRQSTVFPDGFIEETLQTLYLLLPYQHSETRTWYQKEAKYRGLDRSACMRGRRMSTRYGKIEDFKFWRERLILLKEAYDLAEPNTVSRFWLDKRSPVQWATFWVAVLVLVLTIFFGIVQSIEGALQVYKAYHPSS